MNTLDVNNRWPIAKAGLPFILTGLGLTFLSALFQMPVLPFLFFSLTLMTIYFFRDPNRKSDCGPEDIISPADGKVIAIEAVDSEDSPSGMPCTKISIFMSIFDVHVNRIPFGGIISDISYRPGAFLSANLDKASRDNERNSVILDSGIGRKIAVAQIAGLVARRIACWLETGERVEKGQRFGLIRFGSRVELFIPADARVRVELNQRVVAGTTIMGEFR
ncbi:MAG: phosphatidylserine decarboxylase family protein [Deltaproteobacteria bacterium CG_4_8_14_3_um_filter_51_11]|nr:phosphatidylserine decarboxylase family protein [bacterium]OIP41097.1 MAG: phosphatidylserine decarboxylase [Desulfobacteraceae bacterium CG2_30_51_40]PIP45180.1 MAG: phosphatidylserine decarboxylase family protein [Deltaproteobacteria bacterium CG23_combo_of_CG06-09_8_20_14_all_51_20]PIW00765.1 MAG: phosphatidylserine decarboxylase family protein [Deltaproteobacteria bacterium CG17_big_fil_post_rev_8_21_14_2_50_51_6]PIX20474.1 MAG: phosphatidylserine decarboxylase family protein [Deltaprote